MGSGVRAILGAVLLGVVLVAGNVVAGRVVTGARVDLTADRLYSLSPGVGEVLRGLDEPVRIDFYYSEQAAAEIPQVRTYAQRVREFLNEIAQASGGLVEVRRLDPVPFSDAEDAAQALGLAQIRVDGAGTNLTLGLAAVNSVDEVEVLPYLDPEKERFLEYDVVKALLAVARVSKPRVGLITGAPMAGSFDPRTQQMSPGWQLHAQVGELFELVEVGVAESVLPANLSALMVVHPRGLSPELLRAVDAWVVDGKPTLVAVDPWCESVPDEAGGFGGMSRATASEFSGLLDAWGLTWPSAEVVGDRTLAQRVQVRTQRGIDSVDFPVWIRAGEEQFAEGDPICGGLSTVMFASAGAFGVAEGLPGGVAPVVTPLVSTTEDTQWIPTSSLMFLTDPSTIIAGFEASGKREVLAARLTGKVASAFPSAPVEPGGEGGASPGAGAARTGEANVILFGDVDFMSDQMWIREERMGPISLGFRVFADNGALVMNTLEVLTGERALSSLRGRGEFARPFERVEELRQRADAEYLAEAQRLEDEIAQSEARIGELQRDPAGGMTMILTPEQQAEVESLQVKMLEARRQLRAVRLELREDVESLGRNLMVLNTLVWPAVVAVAAALVALVRGRVRGAGRAGA